MKSPCDEIRLCREKDGFNFICTADFIRTSFGFHRALHDFIAKYRKLWYNYTKEVTSMAENKLADMSTEFAIKILKLTESIKGHYSLSNQL